MTVDYEHVNATLEAIREHTLSAKDYIPTHYVEGMPYSPRRPSPEPIEYIPFQPLFTQRDLNMTILQLDEVSIRVDHLLERIEANAPLWHPDVVACFGPPIRRG